MAIKRYFHGHDKKTEGHENNKIIKTKNHGHDKNTVITLTKIYGHDKKMLPLGRKFMAMKKAQL